MFNILFRNKDTFCNDIMLVNDVSKKFTCKPFGYI